MQSKAEHHKEPHQPASMIVHDMVNKLSAILGQCDLLIEVTEAGTEPANRLAVIRDIAESAAKELNEYSGK